MNKIDLVKNRLELLPFIERLQKERAFAAIVPVSARSGRNLPELLRVVEGLLPDGPAAYPADQLTDKDERFFAGGDPARKAVPAAGRGAAVPLRRGLESFKESEGPACGASRRRSGWSATARRRS